MLFNFIRKSYSNFSRNAYNICSKYFNNSHLEKAQNEIKIFSDKRLPFITNFRALTNIITVVCILAVDFTCFPRKLAKTETYGFSLMDTGVGLFMIANALVAPEARKIYLASTISPVRAFIQNIKECIPLIILGTGRYVSVEILGYQRHVSEYGVHWNFFLTLVGVHWNFFLTLCFQKSLLINIHY